jgi:hypothetical protein
MATEVIEPARYEFAPAEDDGVAFGLSVSQLANIVTTLLLVIAASRGGVPLWALVPLAAPVLIFGAVRARGERLTTLAARWTSWVLRPRQQVHRPPAATLAVPAGGGGGIGGHLARTSAVPPPGWARRLRLIRAPYGNAEVGVWHDGDAYACVLAVAAPATALRDLDEQDTLLAGWGDLLASSGVGAETEKFVVLYPAAAWAHKPGPTARPAR